MEGRYTIRRVVESVRYFLKTIRLRLKRTVLNTDL